MEENDMIINKGGSMSCNGYTVNSNFFNNEIPISYSINNEDLFGGKSLPAGLAFFNTETIPETEPETVSETVPETIENIQMGGLIDTDVYDKFIDKFSSKDENVNIENTKDVASDGEEIEDIENEKINIHEKKSRKISTIGQFKSRKQNIRKKLSKRNHKITFKQTRTKH